MIIIKALKQFQFYRCVCTFYVILRSLERILLMLFKILNTKYRSENNFVALPK